MNVRVTDRQRKRRQNAPQYNQSLTWGRPSICVLFSQDVGQQTDLTRGRVRGGTGRVGEVARHQPRTVWGSRTSPCRDGQGSYRHREQPNLRNMSRPAITTKPFSPMTPHRWVGGIRIGTRQGRDGIAACSHCLTGHQSHLSWGPVGVPSQHQQERWAPQRPQGKGAQQQPQQGEAP